jgi:hypothetical protein
LEIFLIEMLVLAQKQLTQLMAAIPKEAQADRIPNLPREKIPMSPMG